MDNIDQKLDEMANSSSELNPIEMWMRGVISERESKREANGEISEHDIESIISILDSYSDAGGSRMKIDVTDGDGEILVKKYHHGRCDVCSPFANGDAWDLLDDEEKK